MKRTVPWVTLLFASAALAQQSADFKVREHAFNAGGHPAGGSVLFSQDYRITLDAIGDSVTTNRLCGGGYCVLGGLVSFLRPPGEVQDLVFSGPQTLQWSPERSTGTYNLYRDFASQLPGLGYGSCEQAEFPAAQATDVDVPPLGDAYFYLVTARNPIDEEGTKGFDSSGFERANPAPCP